MPKTIGVPRILWYHKHLLQWDKFFHALGVKTIISEYTDEKILKSGLRFTEEEICLPAKVAFGHILSLKDKVDCIFLPHVVSQVRGSYCCPKFIGLPDMIKNTLPNISIFSPIIDSNKHSLRFTLFKTALHFSKDPIRIAQALRYAKAPERPLSMQTKKSTTKIGIIAHPYLTKDAFLNKRLFDKLKALGLTAYDVNELPECVLAKRKEGFKSLNWDFVKRLHAGLLYFLQNGIDGIINISSFGCGPDSLSGELFARTTKDYNRPFLSINIDEHASEDLFDTRLEAFSDICHENNIPTHG